MSISLLIGVSFAYLLVLFAIAWWGDVRAAQNRSLIRSPYVYALSLAVYCTAWTYYGSVGRASEIGLDFLSVYIGPVVFMPLWWLIMRKIIKICRTHNITSIADFVSSRYGKSALLGSMVTVLAVLGVVPYISLQIKAISQSFAIMTEPLADGDIIVAKGFYADYAFYITLSMAAFTMWFGARKIESIRTHEGMVAAITFESLFKLLAFLLTGLFVTYFMFNGFGDIFRQAEAADLGHLLTFNPVQQDSWLYMLILCGLAMLFLPRQFQLGAIENTNVKHLDKALWIFPAYLLVINLFVLPIALSGKMLFANSEIDADLYVLAIPLSQGNKLIALLGYMGGFAAATSMIIVSSLALSLMLTNNLFVPLLLRHPAMQKYYNSQHSGKMVLLIRRLSILLVLTAAYLNLTLAAGELSLVSIGLISFVAVAQFAPAVLGGIYWKEATRTGAKAGLLSGGLLWFYTLVLPTLCLSGVLPQSILTEGPFGIGLLRPEALFGMNTLSPIAQGFFWSIFLNLSVFALVSLWSVPSRSPQEEHQAILFVDTFEFNHYDAQTTPWKRSARRADLETLLRSFLGERRAYELLQQYDQTEEEQSYVLAEASPRFLAHAERWMAGAIGAAAARVVVASAVKEEEIPRADLYALLRETQEYKRVSEELKKLDAQKNEFISTVTHEMRTPLTSIRAFSEILMDNPDMAEDEKEYFLHTVIKETERMTRLIDQVLDLEKLETGKVDMRLEPQDVRSIIGESLESIQQVIKEKKIALELALADELPSVYADRDRLMQVMLNLLSNAIKFCDPQQGQIKVAASTASDFVQVSVSDNGVGVPRAFQQIIFEKFYQAENQTLKKPKGSGLGLAICKKIIQHHRGNIWVESEGKGHTVFTFTLPLN